MSISYHYSRRRFIRDLSLGTAALSPALTTLAAYSAPQKKLGIALVGLGSYSTYQLGPALAQTEWAEKYNIPHTNVYSYDRFDEIARNKEYTLCLVAFMPRCLISWHFPHLSRSSYIQCKTATTCLKLSVA